MTVITTDPEEVVYGSADVCYGLINEMKQVGINVVTKVVVEETLIGRPFSFWSEISTGNGDASLRRVFIYLLHPRCPTKSIRFASRFSVTTTPEQTDVSDCPSSKSARSAAT